MARAARPTARPAAKRRVSAPNDYLQRILRARVYDVAIESALQFAPQLSQRLENRVWLKRADDTAGADAATGAAAAQHRCTPALSGPHARKRPKAARP